MTQPITTPRPVALPSRVGQATAVEQSRAVAEVQAAVVVAQQCPRNIDVSVRDMEASCGQLYLAEKAFYKYPRADKTVTGATVHLARELARCWGNVQYGIAELRRDDEHGQSEMQAFAWDVQTNTRSSHIFIVPHKRDRKKGEPPDLLIDLRDIYENNANNAARRLRMTIFSILPPWYVERAEILCHDTLKRGDGTPLKDRIARSIAMFAELGVREEQLVRKVGRPALVWTPHDLAVLTVAYRSVERGEISVDDEFGQQRVTATEIRDRAKEPEVGVKVDVAEQLHFEVDDGPAQPPADPADAWPQVAQPPDVKEPR